MFIYKRTEPTLWTVGHYILRVLDLTVTQGIDIEAQILRKMAVNEARGTRGRKI